MTKETSPVATPTKTPLQKLNSTLSGVHRSFSTVRLTGKGNRTTTPLSFSLTACSPPSSSIYSSSVPATRCNSAESGEHGSPPSLSSSGNAIGFLAKLKEDQVSGLQVSKGTSKRRIQVSRVVEDGLRLETFFPGLPRSVMIMLLLRMDGNCSEVLRYLFERGWTTQREHRGLFFDGSDDHLTVPYFFGRLSALEVEELLVRREPGSYLTYYRYSVGGDEDYDGALCSLDKPIAKYYVAHFDGSMVKEKLVHGPRTSPVIDKLLHLSHPLSAPVLRNLDFIPYSYQLTEGVSPRFC